MSDGLLALFRGVASTIAVVSLVGFLPVSAWLIELVSHFRVQYIAVLGLGSIAAAIAGEIYQAVLLGAVGLINLWSVASFLPLTRSKPAPNDFKLILINVRMRNRAYRHVKRLLEEEAPDLIGLVEVDEGWLRTVGSLLDRHGYESVAASRDDSYGLAIYSKFRMDYRPLDELGGLAGSYIACKVSIDKQVLNVLLLHLPPPLTPRLLQQRNRSLATIGARLRDSVDEWIVMGDFNVTPWSPQLREASEQAGLQSSRKQRGVRPTWPDQFAPLRIPIDHVLGTKNVSFGPSEVGPSVHSDHLPLIVHFRLKDQ